MSTPGEDVPAGPGSATTPDGPPTRTAGGSSVPVIELRGVTKAYGDTPVLRGVDLDLVAG